MYPIRNVTATGRPSDSYLELRVDGDPTPVLALFYDFIAGARASAQGQPRDGHGDWILGYDWAAGDRTCTHGVNLDAYLFL